MNNDTTTNAIKSRINQYWESSENSDLWNNRERSPITHCSSDGDLLCKLLPIRNRRGKFLRAEPNL